MPKEDTSRRRLGLATAGAVAASALAAALALGTNLGLFGFAGHTDRAGTFTALAGTAPPQPEPAPPPTPEIETRVIDVPVQLPASDEGGASVSDEPVVPAPASAVDQSGGGVASAEDAGPTSNDVAWEDEDHEDEDHAEEDHEDEVEDHADEGDD